jgi:hypothetical protein
LCRQRQTALENEEAAVKAESCGDCGTYLKILYQEKDPKVEAVADDLASLILDAKMEQEGFARSSINLEQRVAQMVLLMAFDPHKVRFEDCQPKRPAANQRQFGVGQPAAIACKAVCQPVIGLMKHKGQTLRMSDLNARYAVKQLTQRGQGEQHGQAALKLRSLDFIPVVPVQRRADIKAPAQAIRRDLPVVRQIAHRLAAVVVESGNAGEDLPHQMLLGAPR